MGSAIFSVKTPIANQLWYNNIPTVSESPYVVTYTEVDNRHIEAIQQQEYQALNDFWSKQPELQKPTFQAQLHVAIDRKKRNASSLMYILELAKYRLNKKIPRTLPFEERKLVLINSEEWNG